MEKVRNYGKAFLLAITFTTFWFCSMAKSADTVEVIPFKSGETENGKKISNISPEGKALPAVNQLLLLNCEKYLLGWSGNLLVDNPRFLNASNWTENVSDASQGDQILITGNVSDLQIQWKLGTGTGRYKWVQAYMLNSTNPISLANQEIFGIDLKGSKLLNNNSVGFELKFEDGFHPPAIMKWDGVPGITRWANKLVALKKQFENHDLVDWSKITVISLAVYSTATTTENINGTLKVRNLISSKTSGWNEAECFEQINSAAYGKINNNALLAIIKRQKPTGLLTTWTEDNSSWLYGQGLALKALTIEGVWNDTTPVNDAAIAAEKLALFLAANQIDRSRGSYWPRAWNSITGISIKDREDDGSIWMGDFPWPLTGLQCYYKKTGDIRVQSAINKALKMLNSLIDGDGKLNTIKIIPDPGNPGKEIEIKVEETSCEAYASVILALYESGRNILADKVWSHIIGVGWDNDLKYWKEATASSRPVLFANTWLAPFLKQKGLEKMALDSLTFAGNGLYTCGPGTPCGLDGIGPIAVWYEGTLSYISAGGPGSYDLFDNIKAHINKDGTVDHYNDNVYAAGVWAVDWHSLDGTSWLYYATAGISPFTILTGSPYRP